MYVFSTGASCALDEKRRRQHLITHLLGFADCRQAKANSSEVVTVLIGTIEFFERNVHSPILRYLLSPNYHVAFTLTSLSCSEFVA